MTRSYPCDRVLAATTRLAETAGGADMDGRSLFTPRPGITGKTAADDAAPWPIGAPRMPLAAPLSGAPSRLSTDVATPQPTIVRLFE